MHVQMAYLLLLPVAYYGTKQIADKMFSMTSDYVLQKENLHDDSEALITAVLSILEKHKDIKEEHPAFKSKVLVEHAVDSLKYTSNTTKEHWFQRNYHYENEQLKHQQEELERRLRLFLLITQC